MAIDKDEVRRIARLAHLEYPRVQGRDGRFEEPAEHLIEDATLERLAADLNQILDHVRELESLDTANVPPTSHPVPLASRMREDVAGEPRDPEDLLAAAPARVENAISVPRIVE
jgi:aspartyl-tRNA(Asn)/glutamyl-tRNA(Gln) amidotransferase subunit C